jgi:hypothetical protein
MSLVICTSLTSMQVHCLELCSLEAFVLISRIELGDFDHVN